MACSKGTNANSLTQPVESVGLSHRVLRELAPACRELSPCFRYEPVGTKAHPMLVKANDDRAAVNPPSISWRLI